MSGRGARCWACCDGTNACRRSAWERAKCVECVDGMSMFCVRFAFGLAMAFSRCNWSVTDFITQRTLTGSAPVRQPYAQVRPHVCKHQLGKVGGLLADPGGPPRDNRCGPLRTQPAPLSGLCQGHPPSDCHHAAALCWSRSARLSEGDHSPQACTTWVRTAGFHIYLT